MNNKSADELITSIYNVVAGIFAGIMFLLLLAFAFVYLF